MGYNYSESIQRSIIFLYKSDQDYFSQIGSLIKPEYFEFDIHSKFYSIITDYYDKYKSLPTDDIILEECKRLKTDKESISDYKDELEYINTLNLESISHKDYYLDLVEHFAKKEAVKHAIANSVNLIKQNKVDEIEPLIKQALSISRVIDIGQDFFRDYHNRWDRLFNEELRDSFGLILPAVNKHLSGGLNRKELAMVVAPAGVGKSLFLANQAVKSLTEGRNVLYISLEMSEDKIGQRLDSIITLIPNGIIKDKRDQVEKRFKAFKANFPKGSLKIKEFPTGTANVNHIKSLLAQLRSKEGFIPDVILVDYLELLRPIREDVPEYLAQELIARELRGLAMELGILIWTATQTNRQGASAEVITDQHLADSYGKIRTADFALSLNQTQEEYDNGRMRAFMFKVRNGKSKYLVPMTVNYNTLTMKESRDEEQDIEPVVEEEAQNEA